MIKNFEDIFPILDIQNSQMINDDHVITIGYKVSYEEVFLKTKESYNALQELQRTFIRQLPDYAIHHTLSFFDEDQHIPEFHTIDNYLNRYSAMFYMGRSIPIQKEYIFISFARKSMPKTPGKISLVKGLSTLTKNPYTESLEYAERTEIQIESMDVSIKSLYSDFEVTRLDNDGLAQALYEYCSLEYKAENVKDYRLPSINFKDNIIGDSHLTSFSLYEGVKSRSFSPLSMTNPKDVRSEVSQIDTPGKINQSQMFPITIGLPYKHCYSTIIQKIPKEALIVQFDLEQRSLQLPANFSISSAVQKLKDIKQYKAQLDEGDYASVRFSMTLLIPEKKKELINMKKEALKSAVGNIFEMKAIDENEETGLVFMSNIPGNVSINYKHNLSTAFHAVSYLPKESHYKSDKIGYPFVDRFGRQVLINLLSNPHMTNRNGIVIGPSGRGKSFLLNYLVKLFYNDCHIIIIDKGGSYKNLCNLLQGKYLDSNNDELFQFNIFTIDKDRNGKYITEGFQYSIQLNFILSITLFIWKENDKAKNEEKKIVKNLIEFYYQYINKKGEHPSFTGFIKFIKDNRKTFPDSYETFFDYTSFFLMTEDYATGSEKNLLNSKDNLDLTLERLTVFEMGAIEKANPQKFNLLCIIITFLNIKKIQKLPRSTPKSFIIDEALSFLKGEIGEFIGNLYAEVRKENGQVLVVAQGIKFLFEAPSEVQEKILANRDFIAMTNHSGYEASYDVYRKTLGFKDKDIELLSSTKKQREVFFRFGTKSMILRIEASPEEYAVFTTDPNDMTEIAQLEKKHKSMQTAIEAYAERRKI